MDRLDRGGGGVAAYIKHDIYVKKRDDLQLESIELLWLELKVDKSHCLLGVVYRPPDSPASFWDDFQSAIDMAKQCDIANIIITGDLNADPNTTNGKKLERLVDINNLYLHIHEPTRYTPTSQTCLDQLITSKLDIVKTVHVEPPVSTNDHCTIGATFNFKVSNDKAYYRHVWQYNQGDYKGLNEEIRQSDWNFCFETDDINVMCQRWTDKLLNLARQFIPNYMATIRPKDKPYYTSTLRKQKRKVNRAFHKARRTKTLEDWNTYKTLNTQYTKDVDLAKKEYEISLASSLQNPKQLGPRKWWSTVKRVLGFNPESDIPSIRTENNCIISDNSEKAEEFNQFFLSYSNIDDSQSSLPDNIDTCQSSLGHIQTNCNEVYDILKSLDPTKAVGPDGINPRILKETASSVAPSLTRLFNYSLDCGKFPSSWKKANVTPIHKKNCKTKTDNYRPVSLLSCVGKVLKKIVFNYMFNYFRDNFLISVYQSGFTPGDSTVNQLVCLYHTLCEALDKKKDVRIVFCDISKAFDRVWHAGLVYKLRCMGIRGKLLSWLIHYLQDRYQRVVIKGQMSAWGKLKAGVPQGSVLGPLLFLIYINDIVNVVQNNIRLFADDTALFITVDNPEEAAQSMNNDLNKIQEWADKWLVSFNAQKTKAITVSNRNTIDHPPLYFNNILIEEVQNHKHLGIIINKNLNWHNHVEYITTKALKRLDVLYRCRYKLDRKSLEVLYFTYIRPLLEYGDVLFSDCDQLSMNKIEKVELFAARIVTGAIKRTPAQTLYTELSWEPITCRYEKHKLVLFHKMYVGESPAYLNTLMPETVGENVTYNLRNVDHLQGIYGRTNKFRRSFLPSTIQIWNNLESDIRNMDSCDQFKNAINKNLKNTNELYYFGMRKENILHARIRMQCSCLNEHLFNMYIVDSPRCVCGYATENSEHFLMHCPLFNTQRTTMLTNIQRLTDNVDIHTLLHGDNDISEEFNKEVFSSVHRFIIDTKRFM